MLRTVGILVLCYLIAAILGEVIIRLTETEIRFDRMFMFWGGMLYVYLAEGNERSR